MNARGFLRNLFRPVEWFPEQIVLPEDRPVPAARCFLCGASGVPMVDVALPIGPLWLACLLTGSPRREQVCADTVCAHEELTERKQP